MGTGGETDYKSGSGNASGAKQQDSSGIQMSMDQTLAESKEPVYAVLFPAKGNFANAVCLWVDMKRLGYWEYKILKSLYYGDEDVEIIKKLGVSPENYFALKSKTCERIRKYMDGKDDG